MLPVCWPIWVVNWGTRLGAGFSTVSSFKLLLCTEAIDANCCYASIVEGALTMFFALVAMFMLPDFPHNSKRGFTEEELKVAQLRMLEDVGEIDQDSKDEKWHTGFIMAVTVREGGWK